MNTEPTAELFARLGVRPLRSLGGRVNRHWLVESGGERLVLRRWGSQPLESIEFERRLISCLFISGWPVAPLDEPVEMDGRLWSLAPFLPGEPLSARGVPEQRALGRLLAEFHAETALVEGLGQRPGWRRCEEILADPELDRILSAAERERGEEVRIVRWHLDRARNRVEDLRLEERASIPVHGDFAPWNLLFQDGRLSGLIDFEIARCDHRMADFALSWRGKYDAVLEGYEEASPLEPVEKAALVPIWWAELIEGACENFRFERNDDGWTITKLLARTPAMGPDAKPMP